MIFSFGFEAMDSGSGLRVIQTREVMAGCAKA